MIRPAGTADSDAVGRMWTALMESQAAMDERFTPSDDARRRFDNDFRQWIRSDSRKMYVAVSGETVCGFVTAERWGPPPVYRDRPGIYVQEIYVDESFRREGYGRALVDAVRSWGERLGAWEMRAGVLAHNEVACAFWERVGGAEITRSYAVPLEAPRTDREESGRTLGFSLG